MKNYKRLLFALALGGLIFSGGVTLPTSSGKPTQSAFDENGLLKGPYDLYASKADFEAAKKADDRILVKTHGEIDEQVIKGLGYLGIESLGGESGWSVAYLKNGNASAAVDAARKSGFFDAVDYDYECTPDTVDYEPITANPNKDDEYWLSQCGIVDAWKYMAANGGTAGGTANTVVAVIDTGVDYNHEDLRANMWVNTKEIPNNGVDDDNNGYVDDYYGANCVANTGDPMDDMGHGTHVAGLIAGANNTAGVVGVAYNCKIMAIKAGNSSGYFLNSDIAKALNYAYSMGADVINMSFGGTATTMAVESALETAYARAALVASAGNDGRPNEYIYGAPLPETIYPASYSFVLGVMSEGVAANESAFTNVDAYADNSIEYDVYAPGEQMVSCLPNNQYAKWSGTSMAAPVVSGVAALLRSQYPDRDVYPTKYLMSQIIEASSNSVSCIHNYHHNVPMGLNADDAFTKIPKPTVSLYQYYSFDDTAIDAANDGDGVIDAGETINLGIELQNKGGQAKDVTATIDVTRAGGVSDTYISIVTPTVSYGPIGTYSILGNGLTRDANNNVTEVSNPFALKISADCPNDYLCDINVTYSWANGLDASDTTAYSDASKVQIAVHHGTVLPNLIATDTTLTKGNLYIVAQNTIIQEGVTLTVEPGAKIQWYADSSSYYQSDISQPDSIKFYIRGSLIANGTAEDPIEFFVSQLFTSSHVVYMKTFKGATATFSYCNFSNLSFDSDYFGTSLDSSGDYYWGTVAGTFDHCYFSTDILNSWATFNFKARSVTHSFWDIQNTSANTPDNEFIDFTDNVVRYTRTQYFGEYYSYHIHSSFCRNVIYSTGTAFSGANTYPMDFSLCSLYRGGYYYSATDNGNYVQPCKCEDNAFLPVPSTRDVTSWAKIKSGVSYGRRDATTHEKISALVMKNTCWGGTPTSLIPQLIQDYSDDATSMPIDYTSSPYVEGNDLSALWSFVKNIHMEDADGNTLATVSTDKVKVVVDFNRDMDTTMNLDVAFGSVEPFNDYTITGAFTSKTQWVGEYTFKTMIENGQQYWRISNGRADTDHFKTLVADKQRFGFTIDTTAAQSMALNAVSDETGVTLTWTQDDFETLAGYNIYRANTEDGLYTKINKALIPADTSTYKDTTVEPGKTYFYNFTVVQTDFTESNPSGKTSVTTLDTMAPNVYHTGITTAYIGKNLVISCTVTDNVGAQNVSLYYRIKGTTEWKKTTMTNLNSTYSAVVDASYITDAGLEYYIAAFDGRNYTYAGSADMPYAVVCKNVITANEKGDVNGDGRVTVLDALMMLQAINDIINLTSEQFARADLNGDGVLTAAEALKILQFANGTITSLS